MDIGYALSSEDHAPRDLVRIAAAAHEAGFDRAWVSDHFHPWNDAQGHSPFVWATLGAISQAARGMHLGTGVTCPTIRIHPAIIAQAAATAAVLCEGRFFLGVGSGENLNEHVLGDYWPEAPTRLEMLDEAVTVLRQLWQGGEQSHDGTYYTVRNARIYDLPDEPIPIYVSAFGPKAIEVAARIGDGYIGTAPQKELLEDFTRQAGADKPKLGGAKCCWGSDEAAARKLAHERWPNMGLPGQLSQELETPALFEQASSLVPEDKVCGSIPCGPDPEQYVSSLRQYADAGYDEVYIHNIGDDQDGFFRFFTDEVRPRL
jgi:G6PDH family F420-dependent oxidoreductase